MINSRNSRNNSRNYYKNSSNFPKNSRFHTTGSWRSLRKNARQKKPWLYKYIIITIHSHLIFEKLVLQSFLSWVISGSLKACLVVRVVFGNCADLVNVVSSGQTLQTICNRKNPFDILKLN